jgi:hypothetical protein
MSAFALTREEPRSGVSKDKLAVLWFETREAALLTIRD